MDRVCCEISCDWSNYLQTLDRTHYDGCAPTVSLIRPFRTRQHEYTFMVSEIDGREKSGREWRHAEEQRGDLVRLYCHAVLVDVSYSIIDRRGSEPSLALARKSGATKNARRSMLRRRGSAGCSIIRPFVRRASAVLGDSVYIQHARDKGDYRPTAAKCEWQMLTKEGEQSPAPMHVYRLLH